MMGINSHYKFNKATYLFFYIAAMFAMQNVSKKGISFVFRASEGRSHKNIS